MANDDTIIAIFEHAEQQLSDGFWTVVGWWKASKTSDDDSTAYNPRCHLVAATKVDTPIVKFV